MNNLGKRKAMNSQKEGSSFRVAQTTGAAEAWFSRFNLKK